MSQSDPEATIVRELLAQGSGFVSGTRLAQKLGLSRVAVWAHMEKLRREGFGFEAVRSRGYRLTARPTGLSPAYVRALLKIRPRPPELLFFDTIDSTNREAERQLTAGRPTPFVVLAAAQTAGRGRFGRSWHSPPEGNLYATFVFRPELPPDRMQSFTLWLGVNLCELVANFTRARPMLKWPNDLYFAERKVGGMLTEARIDADRIRELAFGLGLNVNSRPATWPREAAHRATSLATELGHDVDLNALAAAIVGRVCGAYAEFLADRHRATLAERWSRYDLLTGQPITVRQGGHLFTGTAAGIDAEGSLRLRQADGSERVFRAGEVTLEKRTPA
jgi:BirA family biotin operon repressor/biotin-[acetyl-CoA-carboxylase] ligase